MASAVPRYYCDVCNSRILGERTHCGDCGDYDLCATCAASTTHAVC